MLLMRKYDFVVTTSVVPLRVNVSLIAAYAESKPWIRTVVPVLSAPVFTELAKFMVVAAAGYVYAAAFSQTGTYAVVTEA